MSATATGSGRSLRSKDQYPARVSRLLTLMSGAVLILLSLALRDQAGKVVSVWPQLLLWAAVVAVADLLPVHLGRVMFSMSLPVTLAAGMVFQPVEAALIALVGSFDRRELRSEVRFGRALFNRCQIAATVWGAALAFHAWGVSLPSWPQILLPASAAFLVDFLLNILFVSVPVVLVDGMGPLRLVKAVFEEAPRQYLLGYVSLGLLGVMLAVCESAIGFTSVLLFLAPLALTRQVFLQTHELQAATTKLEEQGRSLHAALEGLADERRDERLVVAGELHDEVLPPLFKVHLMGQVLKQDLASGRLLELDEDLPELLSAIQAAQESIRGLVSALRKSPIGSGGLLPTVRLLAKQMEGAGSTAIELSLDEVGGSYLSQLLVYQVLREALANAARHARASVIRVRLWKEDQFTRLTVEDDGIGFDSGTVDGSHHFGLQLMVERVEAASGRLVIDSRLGVGTLVAAAVPSDA
jgi:signal transduction histidine kinase